MRIFQWKNTRSHLVLCTPSSHAKLSHQNHKQVYKAESKLLHSHDLLTFVFPEGTSLPPSHNFTIMHQSMGTPLRHCQFNWPSTEYWLIECNLVKIKSLSIAGGMICKREMCETSEKTSLQSAGSQLFLYVTGVLVNWVSAKKCDG